MGRAAIQNISKRQYIAALQKGETYDTPDDEHTPGNGFTRRVLCYITHIQYS